MASVYSQRCNGPVANSSKTIVITSPDARKMMNARGCTATNQNLDLATTEADQKAESEIKTSPPAALVQCRITVK